MNKCHSWGYCRRRKLNPNNWIRKSGIRIRLLRFVECLPHKECIVFEHIEYTPDHFHCIPRWLCRCLFHRDPDSRCSNKSHSRNRLYRFVRHYQHNPHTLLSHIEHTLNYRMCIVRQFDKLMECQLPDRYCLGKQDNRNCWYLSALDYLRRVDIPPTQTGHMSARYMCNFPLFDKLLGFPGRDNRRFDKRDNRICRCLWLPDPTRKYRKIFQNRWHIRCRPYRWFDIRRKQVVRYICDSR